MVDRGIFIGNNGYMKTGDRVKGIMKENRITISEVAGKMGISRQALYKSLERDMGVERFLEIMEVMGYSVYYGKDGVVKKL